MITPALRLRSRLPRRRFAVSAPTRRVQRTVGAVLILTLAGTSWIAPRPAEAQSVTTSDAGAADPADAEPNPADARSANPSAPPRRPVIVPTLDARQTLALRGVTEGEWNAVTADPWSDQEWPTTARIAYFVQQFAPADWLRWRDTGASARPPVVRDPASVESGETASITARAVGLTVRPVPTEMADFLQLSELYVVEIVVPTEPNRPTEDDTSEMAATGTTTARAWVITPTVPEPWRGGRYDLATGTPIQFDGISLGPVPPPQPVNASAEDTNPADAVAFIAPRMAWHPDRGSPDVTEAIVTLAAAGFDAATLDAIRQRPRASRMIAAENATMFGMAGAVSWLPVDSFRADATPVAIEALLTDPAPWQGQEVKLTGRLTRITPMPIDDPILTAQTGLKECYQVDVMVSIGSTVLKLRTGPEPEDVLEIRRSFPVSVCTPDLPESVHRLWRERLARGENRGYDVPVEVAGVFYRLAAFETPALEQSAGRRQPMPIVVGRIHPLEATGDGVVQGLGAWFAGLFVVAALWAVWYVWRMTQSDHALDVTRRRAEREAVAGRLQSFRPVVAGPPDFDAIARMDKGREKPGAK